MKTLQDECPLERDKWGHVIKAKTDPYGQPVAVIGDQDNAYFFDYAFVSDETGQGWCVLHTTINSETGGFIQDGHYEVLPFNPLDPSNIIRTAASMVDDAVEWCLFSGAAIRFNRAEEYHFIREVALDCIRKGNVAGYEDRLAKYTRRQIKQGGKDINRLVNSMADCKLMPE